MASNIELLQDLHQRLVLNYNNAVPFEQLEEDRLAVLNALEKQIPKKPIGIYDENIYHIDDDDYNYEPARFGSCPACNQEVQDGMLFCSFCGQALDWSDTNG